jgi:hypothetical protein
MPWRCLVGALEGGRPFFTGSNAGALARSFWAATGRRGDCAGARFCAGEEGFFDKEVYES